MKDFGINVMPNVTHTPGVGHSYLHKHTFHELVLITCGNGIHVTGRERAPLATGDVLVIHPGRSHRYVPLRDFELTNILSEPDELARLPHDIRALPGFRRLFEPELDGNRLPVFRNLARLEDQDFRKAKTLAYRLNATILGRLVDWKNLARRQFACLVRHVSAICRPRPTPGAAPEPRFSAVMAFLESNPTRKVTLDELAAMAQMSRSTFQRAFRAACGGSPIRYLIRSKISRAEHLLRTTRLSVTEIAFRTGFEDSNYFIRAFRKVNDMTPLQYRRT